MIEESGIEKLGGSFTWGGTGRMFANTHLSPPLSPPQLNLTIPKKNLSVLLPTKNLTALLAPKNLSYLKVWG